LALPATREVLGIFFVFKRICGLMLACGVLAACSGNGQQSVVPQTAPVTDPQLASTPAAQTSGSVSTMSTTVAPISHITVVVMENYNYSQLIGNSSAPYLNSFAKANAFFTNSSAVTHPSEPNYLALFSGSTQGLTSDACPVTYSGANLATELAAKGYSFAAYAENWPGTGACTASPSSSVSSGYLYWRKHAPWASFSNVPLSDGHSYGGPGTALNGTVNFVVPNICDDMHDCSIATGDAWLSKNIPPILNYDNTHNGLLIVTFDEGDNSTTNHIVTIAAGPMVHNGTYTQAINHYSILRLIEDNFGLPRLGASANVTPISGVLSTSTATPAPTVTATPAPTTSGTSLSGQITYSTYFTSSGEFQMKTSSGALVWVYTSSSTQWTKNGLTVKPGDYVKVGGSFTNSTSFKASSVTLSTSSLATATPAPTSGTSVNGQIVYCTYFASSGEFQIKTTSGTLAWVYTSSSTQWVKNGLTVKNGDYVALAGTWSNSTSFKASSVTLKSSP
jgi:phosphatidylinositol-3-phosphatase